MVAGGVLRPKTNGNPGVSGGTGAFNNKSSWVPDRTSKSAGKRNFMIAKSQEKLHSINVLDRTNKMALNTIPLPHEDDEI